MWVHITCPICKAQLLCLLGRQDSTPWHPQKHANLQKRLALTPYLDQSCRLLN